MATCFIILLPKERVNRERRDKMRIRVRQSVEAVLLFGAKMIEFSPLSRLGIKKVLLILKGPKQNHKLTQQKSTKKK